MLKKLNKFQIINIVVFAIYCLLFICEIGKVCVWASHRELCEVDYVCLANSFEIFVIYMLLFIFSFIFEKNGKFRVTSIVFYSICSLIAPFRIAQKISDFKQLFFATEYYTPVFIDKFTTLFELCVISIFTLLLVSYFMYLIHKRHFKKAKGEQSNEKMV